MSDKDAIILALLNMKNDDWRVIKLREKLAEENWRIIIAKHEHNH